MLPKFTLVGNKAQTCLSSSKPVLLVTMPYCPNAGFTGMEVPGGKGQDGKLALHILQCLVQCRCAQAPSKHLRKRFKSPSDVHNGDYACYF